MFWTGSDVDIGGKFMSICWKAWGWGSTIGMLEAETRKHCEGGIILHVTEAFEAEKSISILLIHTSVWQPFNKMLLTVEQGVTHYYPHPPDI